MSETFKGWYGRKEAQEGYGMWVSGTHKTLLDVKNFWDSSELAKKIDFFDLYSALYTFRKSNVHVF